MEKELRDLVIKGNPRNRELFLLFEEIAKREGVFQDRSRIGILDRALDQFLAEDTLDCQKIERMKLKEDPDAEPMPAILHLRADRTKIQAAAERIKESFTISVVQTPFLLRLVLHSYLSYLLAMPGSSEPQPVNAVSCNPQAEEERCNAVDAEEKQAVKVRLAYQSFYKQAPLSAQAARELASAWVEQGVELICLSHCCLAEQDELVVALISRGYMLITPIGLTDEQIHSSRFTAALYLFVNINSIEFGQRRTNSAAFPGRKVAGRIMKDGKNLEAFFISVPRDGHGDERDRLRASTLFELYRWYSYMQNQGTNLLIGLEISPDELSAPETASVLLPLFRELQDPSYSLAGAGGEDFFPLVTRGLPVSVSCIRTSLSRPCLVSELIL